MGVGLPGLGLPSRPPEKNSLVQSIRENGVLETMLGGDGRGAETERRTGGQKLEDKVMFEYQGKPDEQDEALHFFHETFPAQRIYRILRRRSRQLGEGTPALELRPEWAGLRGLEALKTLLPAFCQALGLPAPRTPLAEEIGQIYRSTQEFLVEIPMPNPFELLDGNLEEKIGDLLEGAVWRRRALERGVPEAWGVGSWESIDLALATPTAWWPWAWRSTPASPPRPGHPCSTTKTPIFPCT